MHGLRDTKVLLQARYDVIMISPPGGAPRDFFLDEFWKSEHDFLITFLSNFLSAMHGFRDNDVLLQAGYDAILIFPPGGAPRDFSWRIIKEQPWLPDSIL